MTLKEQFLEGTDWTTDGMGTLICPCGHRVEDDGHCPNGCESPMLSAGLI